MIVSERLANKLGKSCTLREVIDEFVDERSGIFEDGMIPEIRKDLQSKAEREQENIKEALKKHVSRIALPAQWKNHQEVIHTAVKMYMYNAFGMHYDRLCPKLFGLERKEEVYPEGKESQHPVEVTMPLFANTEVGNFNAKWEWNHETTGAYSNHIFKITSAAPLIPEQARKEVREARVRYHELCAKTLGEPILGDALQSHLESGKGSLDMTMYWIPSVEELHIEVETIDRDPFIVGKLYGKHYLIARWDVEGEKPFEHYLREFIEEKARG